MLEDSVNCSCYQLSLCENFTGSLNCSSNETIAAIPSTASPGYERSFVPASYALKDDLVYCKLKSGNPKAYFEREIVKTYKDNLTYYKLTDIPDNDKVRLMRITHPIIVLCLYFDIIMRTVYGETS